MQTHVGLVKIRENPDFNGEPAAHLNGPLKNGPKTTGKHQGVDIALAHFTP
jgi:hypothetical protein